MTLLTLVRNPPYSETLLAQGKGLLADGKPEVAVVVAQMAVEVYVEGMLSRLIAGRQLGDLATVIESLVPDRTFMDARTRDLFEVLTGDKLSKAPEWKPYHIHVERRNRLVHSAHRVSMGEAQASLVAVECFLDHLTVIRGLPAM